MNRAQRKKPNHMDKIKERQILNGHFQRVWNQRVAIDNKTPRSLKTNPKGLYKRQNVPRSRSAEPLFSSTQQSANASNGLRPFSALTDLEMHQQRRLLKPSDIIKTESLAGESFRYERRYLDGDVMARNFYHFAQPMRAFMPRTLLTNFAESKVAKQRYYQGPRIRNNSGSPIEEIKKSTLTRSQTVTVNNGLSPEDQNKTRTISRMTDSPSLELFIKTPTTAPSIRRERISPNIISDRPKSMIKERLDKEVEDSKYFEFIHEVTSDIVERGVYDEKVVKSVMAYHMEMRKHELNMSKMKLLLCKLLDDLGISKDGFLSVYVDKAAHPESFSADDHSELIRKASPSRPEWDPGDFRKMEESIKVEKDPNENEENQLSDDDLKSSKCSLSLNAEDIDDLLEDRHIGRLVKKVSHHESEHSDHQSNLDDTVSDDQSAEDEQTIGEVSDIEPDGQEESGDDEPASEHSSTISRSTESQRSEPIPSPKVPVVVQELEPLPVSDSSSSDQNNDILSVPPPNFDTSLEYDQNRSPPDHGDPPRQDSLKEDNDPEMDKSEEIRLKRQNFLQKLEKVDNEHNVEREEGHIGRDRDVDQESIESDKSQQNDQSLSFEDDESEIGRGFPPLSPITELPESPGEVKEHVRSPKDESIASEVMNSEKEESVSSDAAEITASDVEEEKDVEKSV